MYTITRRIEIDAGHRIPNHESKCFNIHGHRYVVEATCEAVEGLIEEGSEQGMVLDFGFLKEEMVEVIDKNCDHVLMLYYRDILMYNLLAPSVAATALETVVACGYARYDCPYGKIYLMKVIPTAENLAELWFNLLQRKIAQRSGGRAKLASLKVWETPNCSAVYKP